MAKYDITYKCGHTDRVNIVGPMRSRDSRIEYLESGECYECYKHHSTDAAREQAEALELPALIGSEKQVAWGETLRVKKLHEIDAFVEEITSRIPKDPGERQDRAKEQYRLILLAEEQISNETSAKQWIEWRNVSVQLIITRVMDAMKKKPTAEQLKQQRDEQEREIALQKAALAEATIRPESPRTEIVAEIRWNDNVITVEYPEIDDQFNALVRSLDYSFSAGRVWKRKIEGFAGKIEDRIVELGYTLLSHGFLVRVFDEEFRARILTGSFTPEHTRWITKFLQQDDYYGWFFLKWGKNENYYQEARQIHQSRYRSPFVVVPPEQFEQVLDFADRYDFKLSRGAQEIVKNAREHKAAMIVMKTLPTPPSSVDTRPPNLTIPDEVKIDEELKDDE